MVSAWLIYILRQTPRRLILTDLSAILSDSGAVAARLLDWVDPVCILWHWG